MLTGTSSLHVPFGGIAPALNALLAGQVDYIFDSATSIPRVAAGKVKALAVIGPARLPSLPTVPTLTELGFADMTAVNGFYASVGRTRRRRWSRPSAISLPAGATRAAPVPRNGSRRLHNRPPLAFRIR